MDGRNVGSYSRVIALGTIEGSGGTIRTLDYYLGHAIAAPITDEEKRRLSAIEIRGHSAAIDIGNSDLGAKDTQAANLPYFRDNITYTHCLTNYARANGAGTISSVLAEIWIADTDRVADITNA